MLSFSLTYYACLFTELLYPTYSSLKAIQSSSVMDDTQWLTYWVVYAFLSTFESVGAVVLNWIPAYYELKLAFVIWMIAPQTQGARKIYEDYLVPLLKKYGDKLDPIFGKAEAALKSKMVSQLAMYVDKHGPAIAEEALKKAQEQAVKMGTMAQAVASEHLNKKE